VKTKEKINLVWLKRDIRTQDHLPLDLAENEDLPYLLFYCFEPMMLAYPDCAERHLRFIYQSIFDVDSKLARFNKKVTVFYAEAVEALSFIFKHFEVQQMFSYQESGIKITWDRDKAVKLLCTKNRVPWNEVQKAGVQRGIQNRKLWDKQWYLEMNKPFVQNRWSIGWNGRKHRR